ncbi:MAG: hypothetical protein ABR498_08540 [Candidatus Dormibacteria bacterium]
MAVAGHSPAAPAGEPDQRPAASIDEWLAWLHREAEVRLAQCRDDEDHLDHLWQEILQHADQARPDELRRIVDERVRAASRTAAAATAVEVASEAARQVSGGERSTVLDARSVVDAQVLRRLLGGIASDRATTALAVGRDVLEMLCSITLELEVAERRVGKEFGTGAHALGDLRGHISDAATRLRALPSPSALRPDAGEQLAVVVRRTLATYGGSLEIGLEWAGGEPRRGESAVATVWVLQELVHELHGSFAGRCDISVRIDASGAVILRVSSPSRALRAGDDEPDWLLRTRLRVQLAGGSVETTDDASSSAVVVRLP